MLRLAITFAVLCIVFAFATQGEIKTALGFVAPAATEAAAPAPAAPKGPQVLRPLAQAAVVGGFREAAIRADSHGQYSADFLINGVVVHGLVDTGATFVSLTPETIGRLGLAINRAGPQYRMRTANGETIAWPVKLATISLQGLYVQDVDAIVGEGAGLSDNLIGASFLKKLLSAEQRGGMLVLRQ